MPTRTGARTVGQFEAIAQQYLARRSFWRSRNRELLFLALSGIILAALAAIVTAQHFAIDRHKILPLPDACIVWMRSLGALLGGFLLAHLAFRFRRFGGSETMLPLVQTLTGIGCILMFAFPESHHVLYRDYIQGALIGCALLTAAALWPRIDSIASYKYSLAAGAAALSVVLIFFGSGPKGTDTRINLFGLFQPSELVKMLTVLFLAGYFTNRDTELRRLHSFQFAGVTAPRFRDALPVLLFVAATLGFFFIERDLGPALVIYLVFLGMFTQIAKRPFYGLSGLAALIGVFVYVYRTGLLATVCTRIEMWLSPWDNYRPGGIQLAQSLWALAAGGLFGRGFRAPGVHWIPAGHTDLILAAAGETLGFAGLVAILGLLAALVLASLRVARNCKSTAASYVALGGALLMGAQTAIIAGATLGLLPLTGIPVPFLSYGKSATIVQFLLIGIVLNASSLPESDLRPRRMAWAPAALAVILLTIGGAAARIMILAPNAVSARCALTPQADEVRRFAVNPRLLALAGQIPRGRILDRNGVTLADNQDGHRVYFLGADAVHVIGHVGGLWTPAYTIEKRFDSTLRGYRLQETVRMVDGKRTLERDYSALTPALYSPARLAALTGLNRDVRLALDSRLQSRMAQSLRDNMPIIRGRKRTKGAGVVLRASTGEVLASVSLPGYDPEADGGEDTAFSGDKAALDRARFEIAPPGSTFKTILAGIALDQEFSDFTITCRHKQAVGWQWGGREHRRNVTDDAKESAHGPIGLKDAYRHSCNIYFASLGVSLGAQRIFDTARSLHLALKGVERKDDLLPNLPDNSYGQARVTVTPLEMAAVAASIVNGGNYMAPALAGPAPAPERVWKPETAAALAEMMREVVLSGTGGAARVRGVIVGGKTGTAQNHGADSHSWFIGYAYREDEKTEDAIAFAFLIENGGYGGGPAAHAAGQFLRAIYQK